MIICSCNNVREREVRNVCSPDTTCAEDVMDELGCEFKCGRCLPFVQEMLCSFLVESRPTSSRTKKPVVQNENSLQQSAC